MTRPARAETCPICGRPAQTQTHPFCSARSAEVDLSRWLTDAYAVPVDPDEDEAGHDDRRPLPGHDGTG